MSAPSYTYNLVNGTTADASHVTQNFNDILNGVTDGTKDLTISALTANGSANLKAAVTLGSSSANDLTVNAALASTIPIKTNNSVAIGSSTAGLSGLYLGNGGVGATCQIISASHATARTYTIPDCSAAASFVMTKSSQTLTGALTFTGALITTDTGISFGGNTALNYYVETTNSLVFDAGAFTGGNAQTVTCAINRVGKIVTIFIPTISATPSGSAVSMSTSLTPLSNFAPATRTRGYAQMTVAGTDVAGLIDISTAGLVTLYFHTDQATLSGTSANTGCRGFSYSYTMAN